MPTNKTTAYFKTIFQALNGIGKKIIIFLALVFILSIAGITILAIKHNVEDKSFGRTISDTLLKIISGTVIGTVAALLVSDYSEKQLEKKNRDRYMKDVLLRLQNLYAKTKNARRMLRAKGFTTQWYGMENDACKLKQSVYDLYMSDINDSQLKLEAIRKEINPAQSIFVNPAIIVGNIKDMDDYLGKIISEYEKTSAAFKGEPAVLEIGNLPDLKRFLSKAGETDGFKVKFSKPCTSVRVNIRDKINFVFPEKEADIEKIDHDIEE